MKAKSWNPWPVSIIAFFTVAILGCASYVVFCSLHPTELVTADYYEQELRHDGHMEREGRTRGLQGRASVSLDPATATIRIALPPEHAEEAARSGSVHLYRPSASGLDQRIKLTPDAHGVHNLDARTLSPGLWKVKVLWSFGGVEYFLDERIIIPPPAA